MSRSLQAVLKNSACPAGIALLAGRFFLKIGNYRLCLICLRHILASRSQTLRPALPPPPQKKAGGPALSVIIPTLNRAASLSRCLESIARQSLPQERFEVVVVDNGSSDGTKELCQGMAGRFINFSQVTENTRGLLAARHAGWRAARGDILVFCDDDIEALSRWLETLEAMFAEDESLMLAGGNNLPAFESAPPVWMEGLWQEEGGLRWNSCHSLIEGITAPMEAPFPGLVFGCNFAIRRMALEKAGGFFPDVMGNMLFQGSGETGTAQAAAGLGTVRLHPEASVRHHMPSSRLTLDYMEKRGVYHGVEELYAYLRNGEGGLPEKKKGRQDNEAWRRFAEGRNKAFDFYAAAVCASPDLRDWIVRPTYLGAEEPPARALKACRDLSASFRW